VVPHLDVQAVRDALRSAPSRRRWVVTESYFSMDGDAPDLAALRSVCDELDAGLVVDEAHALGATGPAGRGLAAARGIRPDVLIGTLGKSLALQGAFVAGSRALVAWLWNRARSFVFSTGLSPVLASAAAAAVELAAADDEGRARLAEAAAALRAGLARSGVPIGAGSFGAIVPVVLGSPARAIAVSRALVAGGFAVQAIRPPTVPDGTARLRLTASALLTPADAARATAAIADAVRSTPA
jgi:8-amino-7-oxononanoate synthase